MHILMDNERFNAQCCIYPVV